jgi:hypothetical protein
MVPLTPPFTSAKERYLRAAEYEFSKFERRERLNEPLNLASVFGPQSEPVVTNQGYSRLAAPP